MTRSSPRLWIYGMLTFMVLAFIFIMTGAEINNPTSIGTIMSGLFLFALFVGLPIWTVISLKTIVLSDNEIVVKKLFIGKEIRWPKSAIRGYQFFEGVVPNVGLTYWELRILSIDGEKIVITSLGNQNVFDLKRSLEQFPDLLYEVKNQYSTKPKAN